MPGEYLVDTSVVAPLFRGETALAERFDAAERIVLSSVVLGELYFGAERSSRPEENHAQIDAFAVGCRFVGCDAMTARQYGRIKQQLRARGRPIPENDIWVAATALQHGLVLVARDQHFSEVEELTVERW